MLKVSLIFALFTFFLFASGGFAQTLDQRLDSYFSDYNRPDLPGASVAIYHKGQIVIAKAYGSARLSSSEQASTSTNYRLASVSKAFTAMAIMILQERGHLAYDDAITKHLKDFPVYGQKVTIRHLLNHISGLRDYEELIPGGTTTQVTDADVVRILAGQNSTYFTPGTQYRYSNSGYATLAHLVSVVSGQSFASFLKQEVFLPLGMEKTVAYEKGVSEVHQRAYGHEPNGSRYREADQSLTSAVLGDGGIYTSVEEYFFWDQALYTGQLVSLATLEQAFTPGTLANGSRTSYGFGWQVDTWRGLKRVSHTGSTIGFKTAVTRIPGRELTVLVLVNRGNAAPWDKAKKILEMYVDEFSSTF